MLSRPCLPDFREVCALLVLSRIHGVRLFRVTLVLLGLLETEWLYHDSQNSESCKNRTSSITRNA
jgi:hypothetical protein